MRTILVATAAYFGLVFGTGFVLGVVRTLFLLPVLGERTSELIEAPIMIVAIILSARFVLDRFPISPRLSARLAVGLGALLLLLAVELSVVLRLRQLTLEEYVANRDPIAGAVYVASLIFFGLAPSLLGARARPRAKSSDG